MAEPGVNSVQDIKAELGPKLCGYLDFDVQQNLVRIKPKGFLGKQLFADIAERIRACGGDYSKEEHLFKVWLKKAPGKPRRRALKDIAKDLRRVLEELEAWVG